MSCENATSPINIMPTNTTCNEKCKLNYKRIIEKNTLPTLNYQNSHIIVNLSKLKKLILSYK